MGYRQTDCFKIQLLILRILAIWPSDNPSKLYVYYSKLYVFIFVFIFITLYTINFYFLPQQLEIFAEEMIFYFMDIAVVSKVLAFLFMRNKIRKILDMLESEIFQSNTQEEAMIIEKAKKDTLLYWKITAGISFIANGVNLFTPLLMHLIFSVELEFPICKYSFIPEKYKAVFLYPAYAFQCIGMTSHMLYNVNFDTFLLGIMFLVIAQLDILDKKLRRVADNSIVNDIVRGLYYKDKDVNETEFHDKNAIIEMNKCIKHYDEICKYCNLIQDAFSETLFVQFSTGSIKICVCLFRFTLPATFQFLIFLSLYIIVMILQIMVPCWVGSQLMQRSTQISFAVYDCNWTVRCKKFKSNMRLLVERANKPITITGGKMFLLSLRTFTAIMNSAYSIFTLLRHMQAR